MSGFYLLTLLFLSPGVIGFKILSGPSWSHQEITEKAILNVTLQACRAVAEAEGRDFTFPALLTSESVLEACAAQSSAKDFERNKFKWEMGNNRPNSNLISKQDSIGKIAGQLVATVLEKTVPTTFWKMRILNEKLLTSGYFAEATGGINKDSVSSSHGHLHSKAAEVETAATYELLDDVRGAAGDKDFLRIMGVIPGNALCFVIDTTRSMGDDIEAVKTVTSEIINKRVGTKNEPSVYILVPFNDPDFGPLMRTTDANDFKNAINTLVPSGGGDAPEMSLSGLQLALTGAPFGSEIFLFTDAAAKDAYLKPAVTALIERTGSVVNFMITSFSSLRRRRSNSANQQQISVRLAVTDSQVYKDLAAASGGQAVEVSKSQLLEATNAILETSSSTLATLLQAVRNPGKSENFTFAVDETVTNLTIYITGASGAFTLISPSGEVQENTNGSLITSTVLVGNLQALKLKIEVGQWEIKMRSTNPYTLKIMAETPIDFFFSFIKPSEGPFEGYTAVENRPKAGVSGTMKVTLLGSDTATVTEVNFVDSSGSGQVKGTITRQDEDKINRINRINKDYLVQFDTIPSQDFTVVVQGQDGNISTRSNPMTFQRQSNTNIKASSVSVTASQTNAVIEPGTTLSVNFTVSTNGSGGTFTIRATNDQGFSASFPSTLEVVNGGSSADGTVMLTAPSDTESGTEVTLTTEAESPDGDVNYAVLTITALKAVTDLTRPVCELLSLESNCSDICSSSTWQLSVRLSDGVSVTGLERVYLRQGNGTLNTSLTSENDTMTSYEASCCSPTVEIIAVDAVGNVGSCIFTTRVASSTSTTTKPTSTPTTASLASRLVQSSLLGFIIGLLGIHFTSLNL